MKKYCKYCGHKLESVESGLYNEETGEKETCLVCVNQKCDFSIKRCVTCSTRIKAGWLPKQCEGCYYNFK